VAKQKNKGIIKTETIQAAKKGSGGSKVHTSEGLDKKWLLLGGAAAIVAIIAITVGLIFHYVDFETHRTVARVDGIDIPASAVRGQSWQAGVNLSWQFWTAFPDADPEAGINFDLVHEDGRTHGRMAREEATRLAAIRILEWEYAREIGLSVTPEQRMDIMNQIEGFRQQFGDEFEEILSNQGILSEEQLVSDFEFQQMQENLLQEVLGNPEQFAVFEPHMDPEVELDTDVIAAKHILSNFDNFDTEEEAEAFAEEMLERALAGEDFAMLVREYGQDPGMEGNPDGYSFVAGTMVDEFEQATRALEIGEISGLVHSSFGIHIIMRVEPSENEDDIMRPWGQEYVPLEDRMRAAIQRVFEERVETAGIEFLDALDNVPLED